ncbi:MAG: hypothetical protein ABFR32_05050 [Bacteroidota bacterium]
MHKILAFILALVVLFSTFSFTVEKHVCMGEVTDVSYFTKVDSCGMIEDDCKLNDAKHTSFEKENCCDDIQELIPGNQNEQQAIQSLELPPLQFIFISAYSLISIFENTELITPIYGPLPPLIDKDILVLYQTFLI